MHKVNKQNIIIQSLIFPKLHLLLPFTTPAFGFTMSLALNGESYTSIRAWTNGGNEGAKVSSDKFIGKTKKTVSDGRILIIDSKKVSEEGIFDLYLVFEDSASFVLAQLAGLASFRSTIVWD